VTEKLEMSVAVTNREVVDPDEPCPVPDERDGARAVQADEVLCESVAFPETRVPCLQQHTLGPRSKAEAVDEMRVDRFGGGRRVDDRARPDELLERELVDAGTIGEEVTRRIDVRTRMRSEFDPRDVRRIAIHERLRELDRDTWIAFVDRHPRSDCHGDVEQLASRHDPIARSLIVSRATSQMHSSHKDGLRRDVTEETHSRFARGAKVRTRFLPTLRFPVSA
jgi:hypothetical protein